ncbi:magnesium transporter CorA family protein [Polaromonas sp. SM01]|uniref:magnesium transporter CorA family protein n=1 Tax=Polaromonas sp. SM01 TaxID=3085630 RepID=UPI0029814278|nr:magnesium transporter CorA family protein [Polaromonas sp. SM01]MDW5442476.1 magnesium transporter CorA family protein [Polaromonas sp. SM01]
MKSGFVFVPGAVLPATAGERVDILLYTAPDPKEKQEVVERLSLDPHELESALDADEISRVDFSADCVSMIWKQPKNVSIAEQLRFDVGSMGLFLHQDRLIVIVGEDAPSFTAREFQRCGSAEDVLLKLLEQTIRHYLGHLKVIKQITAELGTKITGSMDNQYLLQMLVLGESLIYYINAIEANSGVLAKLEAHAPRLQLNPSQIATLHDLTVDNQQCARQARIYSDVVAGLMDARGTILNNNVSVLLKKLTLISIIFLPLNLIASIGGMSEFSMMTQGIDWRIAYSLFGIAMVTLGWGSWHGLVRVLEKRQRRK